MTNNNYPGYALRRGSTGEQVATMQRLLNELRIAKYPSLTPLRVDGIYGGDTEMCVTQYQILKGLTADGVIGPVTWNAIVEDRAQPQSPDEYPGTALYYGSAGASVEKMQAKLNQIGMIYTSINAVAVDGKFGQNTADAVRRFQRQFGLSADEKIGPKTWDAIVGVCILVTRGTPPTVSTSYPGYILNTGSAGDYVRYVQSYLNRISERSAPGFRAVVVDGRYGSATKALAISFQSRVGLKADGIVGPDTWSKMLKYYNETLYS